MQQDLLAQDVAKLVVDKYAQLPQKFRTRPKEWTVLAGIVAVHSDGHMWLVSLATGTKCNGLPDQPIFDGCVVRDCHAETLSRRGLLRCLIHDILLLRGGASTGCLLETMCRDDEGDSKRAKVDVSYRLRQGLCLYLYVSDTPCGIASEFPRIQNKQEQGGDGTKGRATGAKPVASGVNHMNLRTKSGRSDLPEHKKTRCMSCSDKLVRWSILGMQGGMLAALGVRQPVLLTGVVLGRDAVLSAFDDPSLAQVQHTSCEWNRAKAIVSESLQSSFRRAAASPDTQVLVAEHVGFPQSRQRISPPHPEAAKTVGSSSSGVAVSWIFQGGDHKRQVHNQGAESLVGVRGVREGAGKQVPPQQVASDLCKAQLVQAAKELVADLNLLDATYRQVKQQDADFVARRCAFRQSFPDYQDNSDWDEFVI